MANDEATDYTTLTPSQALPGQRRQSKDSKSSKATNDAGGHADPSQAQPRVPKQANRNRRRNRKGPNARSQEIPNQGIETSETKLPPSIESTQKIDVETKHPQQNKNNTKQRNRPRKNNKQSPATDVITNGQEPKDGTKQQQPTQVQDQKKKNRNNKKSRKRYPWRRFIPAGTVDPITLESLVSLDYPPFALVADAPYDPVPIWPVLDKGDQPSPDDGKSQVNIEELNRKRIAEQWGDVFAKSDDSEDQKQTEPTTLDPTKRHYNLYDGRALAYYIVSQLQFIDPLNRRDLTRDELINLDEYLRRHGFKDLNVTEAYDAKGITISSAGAVAATAQGRADIMQQLARNLLNSLFGGHSTSQPARREQTSLQAQYAALQRQEQAQRQSRQQIPSGVLNPDATPFYRDADVLVSEDGGLMIIDDNENPGMRDGDYSATMVNPYYSARHISARHGSGPFTESPDAFPALPTPSVTPSTASKPQEVPTVDNGCNKVLGKPSKTLARITGAVKKTDPEEQQRQWEAREAARKRAMMANMSFGVDAAIINAIQQQQGLLQPPPGISLVTAQVDVSEKKLQRNMAFAEALGVKPATVRQSIKSGWARPTDNKIGIDEFRNELNTVIYPDILLSQARERMGLLLKLEKKWRSFLQDDKAASLPLNPMDKPTRIFVHHYSDFWNLKTESFDPEPRRYIHCVKLLETHMPYPLLSDAVRSWRGPSQVDCTQPLKASQVQQTSQQAAGQPSKSREVPPPTERVPLLANQRSFAAGEQPDSRPTPALIGAGDLDPSISRFGTLLNERERPKIELAKRTVPLELPPFEPPEKGFDLEADILERRARQEERARRAKEAEEQKRRAIQDAFASDDEDAAGEDSSEGSEWEEPEVVYQGSDDEE